jgi:hypothetical protein
LLEWAIDACLLPRPNPIGLTLMPAQATLSIEELPIGWVDAGIGVAAVFQEHNW